MNRLFVTVCIVFIFKLILPLSVFAQSSITISQNPPFPKEGERVTISLSGHLASLQNSLIVWKENGEMVLEGVGAISYTVPSASNQNITVEITDRRTGIKSNQSVIISTSQIDLLWEAVGSYTPPFYKGKALPPLEANINIVAIPKDKDANSLTYNWEKEFSLQAGHNGRGKNSFSYIATPLEQANAISVRVFSSDNDFEARETITIRYGNSEVVFYEVDSRLGILFNKALKNGILVGDDKEIDMMAVPFFVTAENIGSKALEMVWYVNGNALPVQTIKNRVRLSNTSGLRGRVVASIFVKNKNRLFEEGTVGIELQF